MNDSKISVIWNQIKNKKKKKFKELKIKKNG